MVKNQTAWKNVRSHEEGIVHACDNKTVDRFYDLWFVTAVDSAVNNESVHGKLRT